MRSNDTFEKSMAAIRIYNAIKHNEKLTMVEISKIAHVSYSSVEHIVRELRKCGLCHVSGHVNTGISGAARIQISYGNAPDVQYVKVVIDYKYRKEKRLKRRDTYISKYGINAYRKVCQAYQGHASVVVVDGKSIYRRGERTT